MDRVRRSIRSPVLHFALSGLLAMTVVGVGSLLLVQRSARAEALRDAKNLTRLAARGVAEPALTAGLLDGDPEAISRMDRVIRERVLRDPVVRVKIWAPDGRILYSDLAKLIGERYALDEEEQETRRTDGIQAEISDLGRPENRFDRSFKRLREVYLGIAGPRGTRLLFEVYLRDSSIASGTQRFWREVAPILIGALLLLQLTQLPLAASLVRRLRRGQREREVLLHRAVTASEEERRRIARDLHDGVVQDLAGVSYGLGAAGEDMRRDPAAARSALEQSGSLVRHAMRQLRTLLVDLYPDTLHRQGLPGSISDLLSRLEAQGIATELDVESGLELEPGPQALIFRATQEALRNVTRHAGASHVAVRVGTDDGCCVVSVADDGRGFEGDPGEEDDRPRLGLRMLDDLAREHGGSLDVVSAPGEGTTFSLRVPCRP